ncbi:hypothetical protein F5882DRAFT_480263 [Hyaloscypha sp. PMI_1271]|nr:hypothetical protein F5882DRAFT_480263 [Hyaloscypha sp. PMI_1271]
MVPQCPAGVNCTHNRGPSIAPITLPLFVLAVLAVGARIYSRRLIRQSRTSSDFTIIAGLIFSASVTAMVLYSPRLGLGRQEVPPEQIERLLISLYVGCILYAIAIVVIKISILLLYRSLFPTPGIDLATKIIGAVSVAWGLETALVGILSCRPVRAFWDITVTEKECINTTAFFIANSAAHVIIDVAILTLPIRKVWPLKMSVQKKVVVSFMFLLGGFICVIGIIRLFFLATLKMADVTYSLVDTYVWSSVETSVGVICACLPTLRPLFTKLFPKGGFETRVATAPQLYSTDRHRPHNQLDIENFERIPEYQLGDISPSANSNKTIVVTRVVEQENRVGKLSLDSTKELWRYNH